MDIALVQHSQDYVNRDNCRQNEPRFARERVVKRGGCTLEARVNAFREVDVAFRLLNCFGCIPQRLSRRQIEGDRWLKKWCWKPLRMGIMQDI